MSQLRKRRIRSKMIKDAIQLSLKAAFADAQALLGKDQKNLMKPTSGKIKLSQAIIQIMRPKTVDNMSPEQSRFRLVLGAMLWNLCQLPTAETQRIMKDFCELHPNNQMPLDEILELSLWFRSQKELLFKDDNRKVMGYDFRELPNGKLYFSVVSSD